MKRLFIVESPNKCVKLKKYLGSEYTVKASVGHIRSIPKKGLNIDIKAGFVPTFEVSSDKKKVVKELKEAAKNADEIIIATDSDREGEAIAQHIFDIFNKAEQDKCTRVTFTEITKSAVLKALENKRDIDMNLVNAQKARQVLDRLIGYKISPVLWFSVGSGTSAGRVQSVALKIICEREKEIQAFKPTDYWFVESLLQNANGEFWAKVITKEKDNRYLDEKIAQADLDKLKTAKYKVAKVERKEKQRNAYAPFDTSTLQTACSSNLGWTSKQASMFSQKLYEEGKITYIRTDSFAISQEAIDSVRELIKEAASAEYLPSTPNVYVKKSKAAAQEAHECIRPTDVYDKGDDIDDPDKKKLYKFIRDRFIACQMTPMIVDTVTYSIKTDSKHDLVAKGQSIKFDGWSKVYKYSQTKEETLPSVEEKETLALKDIKSTKHTTQPPSRYKDGSLVEKMEKEGVGRPSTYSSIIEAILKKGYVEKAKGKNSGFQAADLGMRVFDYLQPHFDSFIMDLKFTSELEDKLDEIAHGNKTYLEVVQPVYDQMMIEVQKAQKDAPEKNSTPTGFKCTVCKEGEVVEKGGRFGKFFSCDKYPTCKSIYVKDEEGKFSIKQKAVVKKTGKKCPECEKKGRDGELIERKNRKDNSAFLGCSKYPTCRFSESVE